MNEQHVPEMKFDMVSHKNPILKQEMESFDFNSPPTDPIQLAKDLIDTMMAQQGLGLSANQCGLPLRVFVMRGDPFYAVFNPRIVSFSDEFITLEEGCLTYPGLYIKVSRPKEIRCRFQTPNGETETRTFGGLSARIFQHEYDHMQGVLYHTRARPMEREKAIKTWKKLHRI